MKKKELKAKIKRLKLKLTIYGSKELLNRLDKATEDYCNTIDNAMKEILMGPSWENCYGTFKGNPIAKSDPDLTLVKHEVNNQLDTDVILFPEHARLKFEAETFAFDPKFIKQAIFHDGTVTEFDVTLSPEQIKQLKKDVLKDATR